MLRNIISIRSLNSCYSFSLSKRMIFSSSTKEMNNSDNIHHNFNISEKPLLENRTALLTNCDSHDMANHVASALANYGANVLIHGENEQKLSNLLDKLSVTHSKQHHGYLVHKLNDLNVNIADKVTTFSPNIDIFIHNTNPINIPTIPDVENCNINEFDNVIKSNLTFPYALFQNLLPLILKGNNPSIIFTSSTPDINEDIDNLDNAYFISKFAFNSSRMLTKMLAGSLAKKNIRVNSVDLGRFLSHENEIKALNGNSEIAKTSAFVWLARPDTKTTGSQIDATEWIRRDPKMFTSFY